MPETHRIQPGEVVDVATLPTRADSFCRDRQQAEKEFRELRDELRELQNCFYAEGKQKLLIVFQAMDAGGKDSTIRKVFRGVNPQGVRVASFKRPSARDLAHDFLWRIHREVPGTGMIGVFNRSHYEDVLVVRVDNIVPEQVWRPRYELINQFEQLLTLTGTRVLKFFLHISKAEQKERFERRLHEKESHWKFDIGDLRKREQWEDYMQAYQDMLAMCTTNSAPWYVIPADQKWYRNLAVSRVIVHTLKQMDPQYPQQEHDLSQITIPD